MDNLVNERRESVIDVKGRHRGYKIWIVCPVCEKGRWVREDSLRQKSFTGMCNKCHAKFSSGLMKKHSRWKGGVIQTKSGYIDIRVSPDDFFYPMARKCNCIHEHRLVMAKHLNRCLLPWEVVHHKNGIKNDNRIENLELLSTNKYHLPDMVSKKLLNQLQRTIDRQQEIIKKLQERINTINQQDKI